MKKMYISSCLLTFMLAATPSFAASQDREGLYLSGNIAYAGVATGDYSDSQDSTDYDIDIDHGYGVLAALGYDFGTFRLELEEGYQSNDVSNNPMGSRYALGDNTVTSWSTMVNGYIDAGNDTPWKSFLMLGVGGICVDFDAYGDDIVAAVQLGAGIGYQFTDQLIFEVQYRYLHTENPENDFGEYEYKRQQVLAGVRFLF